MGIFTHLAVYPSNLFKHEVASDNLILYFHYFTPMGLKRPTGITVIAIVTLLIAISYFWSGVGAFLVGDMLSGYVVMGSAIGGILKAIGIVYLLLGGFSVILGMGLLMMKEWARVHGAKFYQVLAFICIVLCIFNLLLLLYAIIYFLFWRHLTKFSTKRTFEEYGYEKPEFAYSSRKPNQPSISASLQSTRIEQQQEEEVTLPDNMILCPNCDTINLKTQNYCKTCATELHD